MPYPATFPIEACNTLIDYFTPGEPTPEICCVAEAAYDVQGYIMSKTIGHPHPPVLAGQEAPAAPVTDAEKAAVLTAFRNNHTAGAAAPRPGIDIPWLLLWEMVKQLVDQLLNDWLSGKLGGGEAAS